MNIYIENIAFKFEIYTFFIAMPILIYFVIYNKHYKTLHRKYFTFVSRSNDESLTKTKNTLTSIKEFV